MTIAAASRSRVAYVPEASFAATPAAPSFVEIRRTLGNLATKKTTVVSDEIQIDRNVRDEYMVGQDVSGSYDFELSYGSFDDMIASVLQSTWTANAISNGTTQQSFTFEEAVDLGGGTLSFSRFLGCEVNSMTLTFVSQAAVKGSVMLMGKQEALDDAAITGATYALPSTSPIMTSVMVASLAIAGITPTPKIKQLALTVANNLRICDRIGSLYSEEFGDGSCDVTGTLDACFETPALYAAVLAHGGGALAMTVGAASGSQYNFSLPNIVFLDGTRRLGGKNDDVMVSIPFRARFDPVSGASLTITRGVA